MSNLHTPPIYHKNDLDFIHSEISKIRYDVRYRVARLYACIILQHLHSHEPDAIRTPNALMLSPMLKIVNASFLFDWL